MPIIKSKHYAKEFFLKLRDVKEILDAHVVVGEENWIWTHTAFGADLMSDVMAFAKAGSLLLTGFDQSPGHQNGCQSKYRRHHRCPGKRAHNRSHRNGQKICKFRF